MEELIKILLQKAPNSAVIVGLIILAALVPALTISILWMGKTIFNFFKGKDDARDIANIELNKSLHENTLAIVKLTTQMEFMTKYITDNIGQIPKIRDDLNGLYSRVKGIEKGEAK